MGGTKIEPGKFLKNDLRFKPVATVKRGATVTLRDKGEQGEPHTISFVEQRYLPRKFSSAVEGQLLKAHQVDPDNEEAPPGSPVVDDGVAVPEGGTLEVDTMFTPTRPGDSAFIAPGRRKFKVTAAKGSKLFFYCALHPWMQGKLSVE